jgi:hypothetical protein
MLTLNDGRSELWQWDTGRKLTVDAECSQVHFSNKVFGRSIDVDVVDGVAIIPDILLQADKGLTAWAFVGTAENGYTKVSKVFNVNKRNKPADYVFTPTDQTTLSQILDRIEDLENRPGVDVSGEDIQNAVNDYLDRNPVSVEEKDPTVPAWAKQPEKPKYTAQEVGAMPADANLPGGGGGEKAATIFETTATETVKRISYSLAEEEKEYTNFLIVVYPVKTATYNGTSHQATFRIYYSNSENAYTQKKPNLNNPVGRPLANEFYWNPELELGRLSYNSDYAFVKNVSATDRVVMLAVDADFTEKWLAGTRVVIKAWRDNL